MRSKDVAITGPRAKEQKVRTYEEPENLEEGIKVDGQAKVLRLYLAQRESEFVKLQKKVESPKNKAAMIQAIRAKLDEGDPGVMSKLAGLAGVGDLTDLLA